MISLTIHIKYLNGEDRTVNFETVDTETGSRHAMANVLQHLLIEHDPEILYHAQSIQILSNPADDTESMSFPVRVF